VTSSVLPVLVLVPGRAAGEILALSEPVSFWGGFDAATGRIVDRLHPDRGACVTGRVLVMCSARGSSSGSSVLAEAIRLGTAPAAIVLRSRDAILTVGALVAATLYDRACPVVVVESDQDFARVAATPRAAIETDETTGRLRLTSPRGQ
jgi:predicted aconitase with swiveling domain